MIHVFVKTNEFGMRKAWYIGVADSQAIIAYKNNDNKRQFTLVSITSVFLDTTFRNETAPVIESLRSVNIKLKGKDRRESL